MQHDPVRVADVRNWMDRASRDLAAGEQCLEYDASLRSVIDSAVPLTEYAWRFRYPGEALEPPLEEAQGALTIARSTYGAILARLPDDAHS